MADREDRGEFGRPRDGFRWLVMTLGLAAAVSAAGASPVVPPQDAQEVCSSPSLIPLDREPRLRNPEFVASDLRRRLGQLPERETRTWYVVDQWGHSDAVEVEGRVVAWVCVDERGRVDNVRISGLGHERILEEASFAWARAMKFDPARRGGSRVAAWVKLPFLLTVE